ncbi:MAG: hypothetical protein PWP65_1815 [Clostridia bacterium]|nr:hypothetical protein [Clostridia bacterium]
MSGAAQMLEFAGEIGIRVTHSLPEGSPLKPGATVLRGQGKPEQIARAEEMILGAIGKPSGVASASERFVRAAGGRVKIVCGAWKKVAPQVRKELRQAIAVGGAGIRITDEPFVYLDKNYVRMLGGVRQAVEKGRELAGRIIVVQLRGEEMPLELEAEVAVQAGAGILMVDTGREEDLAAVVGRAKRRGWREKVKIAFAGGVTLEAVPRLAAAGADILDVGRCIIDAPLLDFRLEVGPSEEMG